MHNKMHLMNNCMRPAQLFVKPRASKLHYLHFRCTDICDFCLHLDDLLLI